MACTPNYFYFLSMLLLTSVHSANCDSNDSHSTDGVFNVTYYEVDYGTLEDLFPSLKIELTGDPYFSQDDLPGFDLGLPDGFLVAEFPQCPESCSCTFGFRMFTAECPDEPIDKNILLVDHLPNILPANSTAIDLSSRQLVDVVPNSFVNRTDVIILLLGHNLLRTIEAGMFNGLDNIHTMDLSNNQISNVDDGSFSNMSDTLRQLLLNVNKLTSISHRWIDALVNVQVLNLGFNDLREEKSDIFSHMQILKVLSLPNCNFSELENLPENLLLLDLASNDFSNISINLSQNLTHLSLDHNQLSLQNDDNNAKIHTDAFHSLKQLRVLAIGHNSIESLQSGVFRDLNLLQELWLEDSNIVSIHENTFNELTKLQLLYLGHNSIESLQSGVFRDLNQLQQLWLNGNKLSSIPGNLFNGSTKLQTINLYGNTLKSIPVNLFSGLTKLQVLQLSYNSIDSLQSGVFHDLHQLQKLYLLQNKLKVISLDIFKGLTELHSLDLGDNNIESLQSGVFRDLHKIQLLGLNNNKLNSIPADLFYGLNELHRLTMSNTSIESLQSGVFSDMPQLQQLWLYANQLVSIPANLFNGLTKLQILYLSHNSIESLQPGVFSGLYQLQQLWLNNNKLVSIPVNLFNGLSELTLLYLGPNNIGSLQSGVFRDLIQLKQLDLGHNQLVVIEKHVFNGLVNLEKLGLLVNKLESLPSGLFKDLVSLKELDLQQNQLTEIPNDLFSPHGRVPLELLNVFSNNISRLYPYQFSNMTHLIYLGLGKNRLNRIPNKCFYGLNKLQLLQLWGNNLYQVNRKSFMGMTLQNNSYITLNESATCCFLEPSSQSQCAPANEKSPYLTCKQLLPTTAVKCCTWIFGFCALFANILVFIWGYRKIKSKSHDQKQMKQIIFITNLSLADLLMGLYLLIIASADQYYNEYFPSYAQYWRKSGFCKFTGFVSVLSSEASLFFLSFIAVERLWTFRNIVIIRKLFGKRGQVLMTIVAWVTALALSIVTVVLQDDKLYQFSDMCIGLPLTRSKTYESNDRNITFKWEYERPDDNNFKIQTLQEIGSELGNFFSIGLFLGINFLLCLTIAVCYIGLFVHIWSSPFSLPKTDLKLAIKMGAIALTDLACWLPIVVLGILAQTEVKELSPEWFPWITTFALPINSVINPFLYTTVGHVSGRIVDRFQPACCNEVESML